MSRFRRQVCAAFAVMAGASLAVVTPTAAAAAPAPPVPVTAGAMPAPQTDGIVFSVAIVGDTVYAGGRFTKARPAGVALGGAGEVPRHNLLAFDLTTGALLPWAPDATGTPYTSATDPGPFCQSTGTDQYLCDSVFRIKKSPDGKKIYVGGDFDKVAGKRRSKVAAFTTSDGTLDPTFAPEVSGRVRGISATADTVYLGGGFRTVGGVTRTRLAALGLDGALKPWAPTADGEVFAVLAAPQQGRVVVGGGFDNVNGARRRAMMAVDATSGANVGWAATAPGTAATVTDIVTDGTGTAYFGSYDYGGTNIRFEGRAAITIATGAVKWWDGCYGDTQSVVVAGGIVYSASHSHDCSAMDAMPQTNPSTYYRLVAETSAATGTAVRSMNNVRQGDPVPEVLPWFPNTNGGPASSYWKNGPWAMDADGRYVVAGGEFTTVNGVAQQSLVRFAARGVSGAVNKGPQTPFAAPVLSKNGTNPVIAWKATWDGQNSDLRYDVYRTGTAAPIYSVTRRSRPWDLPQLSFTDTQVTAGTYRVKAVDADGVVISSPSSTIN
jgi:hypothetical protein